MPLLQLTDIEKRFQTLPLFQGLNLSIDAGDKLGLIGPNGCGKSTLLKIIDGSADFERGRRSQAPRCLIAHYTQIEDADDFSDDSPLVSRRLDALAAEIAQLEEAMASRRGEALEEMLNRYQHLQTEFELEGAYTYQSDMARILAGLGFDEALMERPLSQMSGGERTRVRLARMLLKHADLLLLDEPSNHLDLDGIDWLTSYLQQYKGALILVSHDRYLLNQVCHGILDLEGRKLFRYSGNYVQALEQKRARQAIEARSVERLEEELERQEEVKQTLFQHRNISAYHAREKLCDKLRDKLMALKDSLPAKDKQLQFSFVEDTRLRQDEERILYEFRDTELGFDRTLFKDFSCSIHANDRIAILGPNGCGKTSLLRTLMGNLAPDAGQIRVYGDPKIAYMGQYVQFPDEHSSLYDYFINVSRNRSQSELRARLAQFGFYADDLDKTIQQLSGGERHRLYLCQLLNQAPDLIVLDEPSNHLDIASREVLEQALLEYDGALLLVSHDRYFVEKLSRSVLGFIDGRIAQFDSYQDYQRQRQADLANSTEAAINEVAAKKPVKMSEQASTGINQSDRRKRLAALKRELRELETEIEALEKFHEAFEADPAIEERGVDAYHDYAEKMQKLDEITEIYYERSLELEELEASR
ncbi:MAG: ABC-F family ATP-binding cassette domain-containing protein [Eubacteriales bacterium]|nr:ABC-F family ATP-binding cassette domain-containing protein [Eubacteriales bacterium]